MKKLIHTGILSSIPHSKQGQIVLYREGETLHMQNLELPESFKLSRSGEKYLLEFSLPDGECLVIQDMPGVAEKKALEDL